MKNQLKIVILVFSFFLINTVQAIKANIKNKIFESRLEELLHNKHRELAIADETTNEIAINQPTQINSIDLTWLKAAYAHIKKHLEKYVTGGTLAIMFIIMGKMISNRNKEIRKQKLENEKSIKEGEKYKNYLINSLDDLDDDSIEDDISTYQQKLANEENTFKLNALLKIKEQRIKNKFWNPAEPYNKPNKSKTEKYKQYVVNILNDLNDYSVEDLIKFYENQKQTLDKESFFRLNKLKKIREQRKSQNIWDPVQIVGLQQNRKK